MAIEDVARRVTYTGNGKQTEFPFSFVVFSAQTDIAVYRKVSDDELEETVPASEYSVTLNSDQASSPGGKVVMTSAPADGVTLSLLSNVAYEQTMELTTHDGFDPRTLNKNADRIVALIQQLKEKSERAVTVDATDTLTPAELKQKLLDAAETATVIAKGYADQAAQSAESAKASEEKTAEYAEAATIVAPIADEVKAVAGAVDAVTTVGENIEAVKVVAENVGTVAPIAGEIKTVAGAVDAVTTVSENVEAVKTVAEHAETIAPIAGEIKTVANAVDAVTSVSQNVEAVKVVAENVETVAGVADDMKVVVANVDAIKTVSGITEDVSRVAENADEIAAVGKNIDDVHNAAQLVEHADDISAIKGHLDEVHKVGQDLLGVNSADFDCGEIGDELDSITTVVDGYIKKVAEHIDDCIHPVAEKLATLETVANNLEPVNAVAEVMTTDYEKIFNEGVS